MNRARFKPTFDPEGTPVHSVYRNVISFWIPDGPPAPLPKPSMIDVLVMRKELPAGMPEPAAVYLAITVDTAGAIGDCTPFVPEGLVDAKRVKRAFELMSESACGYLRQHYQPTAAIDAGGQAVPSIQTARVGFTLTKK